MEEFRLSPQQRRLFRLMQQRPERDYCVSYSLRLSPHVSIAQLESALHTVVAHCPELRTRLAFETNSVFPFMVCDVSTGAGVEALAHIDSVDRRLSLSVSPMLGDHASLNLIIRSITRAYHGMPLMDSPRYIDVAAWANELIQGQESAIDQAFWLESDRMAGSDLGLDPIHRQTVLPVEPLVIKVPLNYKALSGLADKVDTSAINVLLAAWHLLLHLRLKRIKVLVGASFDGRSYEGLENAIGSYQRYLPTASAWNPRSSFTDLARSLSSHCDELASHQEYFTPCRDYTGEPEFAFIFQTLSSADIDESPIFELEQVCCLTEPFQIQLAALVDGSHPYLEFQAYSDTCERSDLTTLANCFETLLLNIVEDPQQPISQVKLLSSSESRKLLTRAIGPTETHLAPSLDYLIEQQAARTPDRVAVQFGDRGMAFRELNIKANCLAVQLQELGVESQGVIGLQVNRSPELLVGLLGVLKSGCAYLPIDVSLPTERQKLLLEDANVRVVVSDDPGIARLAPDITVVSPEVSETPANLRVAGRKPGDAAYVLFTSGSTGRPKGVIVTHRNLLNYLRWSAAFYDLERGSGALAHSSLSFDLTVTSLLAPLIVGQTVKLLPQTASIEDLSAAICDSRGLSLLKLTPSHLAMLQRTLTAGQISRSVRTVVIGGEQLHWELIANWCEKAGDVSFVNEYGPTEATVGCCAYRIRPGNRSAGPVPIGTPISNTRIYLLDEQIQPVPEGWQGEIYIGGEGVARGYLNQHELTGSVFLTDPFIPGERLYRTGDLGRLLPSGDIEFIGRSDSQRKISGFRVEPGEVEAVIRRDSSVTQVLVKATSNANGANQLVAYVTGTSNLQLDRLAQICKDALPSYSIPTAFEVLDEFPLTASGKIDESLIEIYAKQVTDTFESSPPRTIKEAILARLWSCELNKEDVGIDENYFTLGGDSIRSLRIVAAARREGIEFTVAQLFSNPTIRLIAAVAEKNSYENGPTPAKFELLNQRDLEQLPADLDDAYPITMLQAGMIFHNDLEAGAAIYHDIFSYHLRLPVNREAFINAADILVEEHEVLRTTFDLVHFSEPLQLVHKSGARIIDVGDLQTMPRSEQDIRIQQWIEEEKERGFQLNELPLLKMQVHLLGKEEVRFMLSFHHAVIDGWSDVSLLTQFFSTYFRLMARQEVKARALQTHYRDFVAVERQTVQSPEMRRFWKQKLEGTACLRLPLQKTAPHDIKEVAVRSVSIDKGVSGALRRLALAESVPVKSLLLGAHMRIMSLLTGQPDVLSCVVASGRPETQDAENALGLFINSIPFRLTLDGGSWTDLANAVFKEECETLEYRRFPLSEIKRMVGHQISESLFYFTHYHLVDQLPPESRPELLELVSHESSSFPLAANFWIDPFTSNVKLNLAFHRGSFLPEQIDEIAAYYQRTLEIMASAPASRYEHADLLSDSEMRRLFLEWNDTSAEFENVRAHERIFRRCHDNRNETAAVFLERELTYGELLSEARRIAGSLREAGVRRGDTVAVLIERGLEMLSAVLGVWAAGAAYLPLDPSLPRRRREQMLNDSGARTLLTQEDLVATLDCGDVMVCLWNSIPHPSDEAFENVTDTDPAYLMYTSGSSGEPHAVIVTHGNLSQFFAAMDARLGVEPGVWLAITNYAFDISLLELFWTLACGYKIVIQGDGDSYFFRKKLRTTIPKPMEFSLFYFASADSAATEDKYRLLTEGARVADRQNFKAIWTPERHFHEFGGLYPNPSLAAAAVAAITERVSIRAGSVVLPLHNPIRVAEEWSVVDNLSHGRVGVSFASGWHSRDFVLSPGVFAQRKSILIENIDIVRSLWRGEALSVSDGEGKNVEIRIHPAPVQKELPVWLSASRDPATFRTAGELNANLLTHLLGQDLGILNERIKLYREHCESDGHVTLMMHTFAGADTSAVREIVRRPFLGYLRSSVELVDVLRGEFGIDPHTLKPEDLEELLDRAFDRYFEAAGLFGSPGRCLEIIDSLRGVGVNEVACLIDFGIDADTVLRSLEDLSFVQRRFNASSEPIVRDYSIAAQIRKYDVTHMQCTPTLAGALMGEETSAEAIGSLRVLLLGGEPLPPVLAEKILGRMSGTLLNMYGPTETTIWSTSAKVESEKITIGTPLQNTQVYILDVFKKPLPVGVVGELHIGGLGVTAGYHRRPQLTSERYLPNPWSSEQGARMHRTGDLGRFSREGEIELLGRNDSQIKISGHRIEPGEIAAILSSHEHVEACVVEATAEKQLTAFVVGEESVNELELRRFLEERVAPPMVPSAFVFLSEFPRTPNGKLDRRALLEIRVDALVPALAQEPRTPLEIEMAAIWKEVLQRDPIGINYRFFDLGGYSLQATMIISRVRERFKVDLPLRTLFEHPTVSGLCAEVLKLREAIFSNIQPIGLDREGMYTTSFAQERLWFIEQIAPGNAAYHDVVALEINGHLDVEKLRKSLGMVVKRHEPLRTVFVESQGSVFQKVLPSGEFHLETVDLCGLPERGQQEELDKQMVESANRPFDLAQGPLLRMILYRIGDEQHVLLLVIHHIVCDGWSLNLLINETAAAYRAMLAGAQFDLPPLRVQYKDYAVWQRKFLAGSRLLELLDYWKDQLHDGAPVSGLPMDHARPAVEAFRGCAQHIQLPTELVASLELLSRDHGATLFMTLFSVFQILLHKYTGNTDLVVGTDVANRNRKEIEPLVGFFVNELVLRTDLSGDPTFSELLDRVRETTLSAYDHQDLPFDRLVDELQPERDLGRNPIYQLAFTLQEPAPTDFGIPDLQMRLRDLEQRTSRVDFEFNLHRSPEGITGKLIYNDTLFEPPTIQRILLHFENLLQSVTSNPYCPISQLSMISVAERRVLVEEWNQTQKLPGQDEVFHRQFEQIVQRSPDAIAIVDKGVAVSYFELNQRANRLAHALNVESAAETPIAVLTRRGIPLLTSMLGIFKAGAAYMPLDPEHPAARHARVLEQSRCPVVLCESEYATALKAEVATFPANARPRLLGLDSLIENSAASGNLEVDSKPESLAYVIFTSGSTGSPKGAMVEHGGMLNHLLAKVEDLHLSAIDRVAQTAPQSFDISIWQYLAPLLTGATVVVYDDDDAQNAGTLLTQIHADEITVFETVPSLLSLMLEELGRCGDQPLLSCLRWIIVTGEQLSGSLCRRWLNSYPRIPMLNAYGPTECSDDVSHFIIREPLPHDFTAAPIGRPIRNTRLYILGPGDEPAPVGAVGELIVSGRGVGRGYLNDPEKTKQAFISDPYSKNVGVRCYRTGDLARYLPTGDILFLGRTDTQVKIGGCRMEMGEIEQVICQYPNVASAIVRPHRDSERTRLVAYVVQRDGAEAADDEESRRERITEWQRIYEDVYGGRAASNDTDFPTIGWNDSSTGLPIPQEEMREWVEETVARVLRHGPKRVLEIGCGTGMLLRRIAPDCSSYIGTDISESALDFIRPHLDALRNVRLLTRSAVDFSQIEPGTVDTVILNSVVQYFPSVKTLMEVLEGAARVLCAGGRIFIGDVRNLRLLEVFHSSVQRHQAGPATPAEEILKRVQRRINQEDELLIAPEFFATLPGRLPGIDSMEVQLKRGRSLNELTMFRYDVTLFSGRTVSDEAPVVLDWCADFLSLTKLRNLLLREHPPLAEIKGIPNRRLVTEVNWYLEQCGGSPECFIESVEPEDVWHALQDLPYNIQVTWCPSGKLNCFAIRLICYDDQGHSNAWPYASTRKKQDASYANNPLQAKFGSDLAIRLREHLRSNLPGNMLPSDFVLIPSVPLTRNGKIDYKSLPPPTYSRPMLGDGYVAPRSEQEKILADIWAAVLKLDRVGIHDNFFELGGDSIMSIQIVSKARLAGLRLTPRQAFQHQTIAELASATQENILVKVDQGPVSGSALLLPQQKRFFEASFADPEYWNQSLMLNLLRPIEPTKIDDALHSLISHHDVLRLRFADKGDGREAHIVQQLADSGFRSFDLSSVPSDQLVNVVEAKSREAQASLNLSDGPLMRVVLFNFGQRLPQSLLIVIHHLAVDGFSWRILIEDLETILAGRSLPPKTTSVQYLAQRLHEHAQTPAVIATLSHWLQVGSHLSELRFVREAAENTVGAALVEVVILSRDETRSLIRDIASLSGASIEDALIASILYAFSVIEGRDELYLDVESHGRDLELEEIDLSRTVGWCATAFPRRLYRLIGGSPADQILHVRQQIHRSTEKDFTFGLLRYCNGDPGVQSALANLPVPEIAFNYFGQLDQFGAKSFFDWSSMPAGPSRSLRGGREHIIEIDCAVRQEVLELRFTYPPKLIPASRISSLANSASDYLRNLGTALLDSHLQTPTPNITQEEWAAAIDEVRFEEDPTSWR